MLDLSIILPTYNEAQSIFTFVTALAQVLQQTKKTFEIIVVDDNSPDGTGQVLEHFAQTNTFLKVFIRENERGLATAIRYGVERARGQVIIGMDADFNHDPATIPLLLKKLDRAPLVVASRFVRGGGMSNQLRFIPTFILNAFFRLIGFPIWDNTSGFYAIRRQDLLALGLDQIYYGYGDYHLRLVMSAKRTGYAIQEVPTYYLPRRSGVSKSKLITMFLDYTREAIRLALLPT